LPHDVRRIANAVLDLADDRGFAITNMALNKLVYFAHGWYLALYDEPLTASPFEAWQFGPVHPTLYRQFKPNEERPIRGRAFILDVATGGMIRAAYDLTARESGHLEQMAEFYGAMSAAKLSAISHEPGAPWDRIWNGSGARPGMIISDSVTASYYKSKLENRT
jgi:uncharacterized phage-associated protein